MLNAPRPHIINFYEEEKNVPVVPAVAGVVQRPFSQDGNNQRTKHREVSLVYGDD